ncbi:rhomboid family intramembrane serine protease [Phaeocystidibacter luteus]|uniref:Rhomboid family intramembrane serine protease n=1 Tax=Phaeocystidibacter luteus TaxID=911197 RepID=A0A6N6RG09_9FLAO|nr:rhomboid family intramembrane serine protease [Phaeocystidibacter luteus]KAB2807309.1 rhomboid family intramembrane serine protease [Phaeocystidibacter luteus]
MNYRPSGFNFLPPVIKNLIIINVLFFVATFALGNSMNYNLVEILGLHYFENPSFGVWQIITHMFMHSPVGFGHIFLNMLVLWMFGTRLENQWGSKRFLNFYLLCGLGAAALHMGVLWYEFNYGATEMVRAVAYHTNAVGASGAIYGILLAYGMTYPNEPIYLYFLFPIRAKYFVSIIAIIELFNGVTNPGSTVAHFAHLGGMLFGYFIIRYWRRQQFRY